MSCRITNIIPACGYRVDGIERIRLLDFEDFAGFEFEGGGLYDSCRVAAVRQTGEAVDVDTPDSAKYTSASQNGLYTHTVESFVGDLAADLVSALHLAARRRFVVFFRTRQGRDFVFGYEGGATVSISGQTAEGVGMAITVTALSAYPLFEVVGFGEVNTLRWGDYVNIWQEAETKVTAEWADYVNIFAWRNEGIEFWAIEEDFIIS